jgi:hypothetical protein
MEDGQLLRKILAPHWWDMSPQEAKIFITLYWFADPDSGEISISLFNLSRKVNADKKEILPHLEKLKLRGLIDFTAATNPYLDSSFKILSVMKKNQVLIDPEIEYLPSDLADNTGTVNNDDDNDFKKNKPIDVSGKRSGRIDLNKSGLTGYATGTGKENALPEPNAREIAEKLHDLDNLALYEAYLRRYPREVILKAFTTVLNTPPERIKKSLGAYFTFLVKKFGNFN